MTTTRLSFGLSDYLLTAKSKSYGPVLRFTLTWATYLEDGRVFAQSTPGFTAVKTKKGYKKVRPPLRHVGVTGNYSACIVTKDLLEIIEKKLEEEDWWKKIGVNRDVNKLMQFDPDDLTGKMPKNVIHL